MTRAVRPPRESEAGRELAKVWKDIFFRIFRAGLEKRSCEWELDGGDGWVDARGQGVGLSTIAGTSLRLLVPGEPRIQARARKSPPPPPSPQHTAIQAHKQAHERTSTQSRGIVYFYPAGVLSHSPTFTTYVAPQVQIPRMGAHEKLSCLQRGERGKGWEERLGLGL